MVRHFSICLNFDLLLKLKMKSSGVFFCMVGVFVVMWSILWFQKAVPCDLCKEILIVVDRILKENGTEVRKT